MSSRYGHNIVTLVSKDKLSSTHDNNCFDVYVEEKYLWNILFNCYRNKYILLERN